MPINEHVDFFTNSCLNEIKYLWSDHIMGILVIRLSF